MDFQVGFNIAAALAGALGGYVLKSISTNIASLTDKVQKLEVLVAGDYVKTTELQSMEGKILDMLNSIYNKLDAKQDKS